MNFWDSSTPMFCILIPDCVIGINVSNLGVSVGLGEVGVVGSDMFLSALKMRFWFVWVKSIFVLINVASL